MKIDRALLPLTLLAASALPAAEPHSEAVSGVVMTIEFYPPQR